MGYPFDRNPRSGVSTLAQFLTSNMAALNVTIKYNNRIVPVPNKTQSTQKTTSTGGAQTGAGSSTTNRNQTGSGGGKGSKKGNQ